MTGEKINYEVFPDGWESSIRPTTRAADDTQNGRPIFSTLGEAKEDLLVFLRDERDQYNITIHMIRTMTRKDVI